LLNPKTINKQQALLALYKFFLTSDANHIFLKTTFFILGFHPKPYTLFQGGKRVEKRLAETMLANASAVA